jgi:predicted ATPase
VASRTAYGGRGLAPLSDPTLVVQEVSQVLGVREAPGRSPTEALAQHLEHKKTLLVLDNCEHLIDACAELVDTLLRSCPKLHILATSREALGVGGEIAWLVPPLSLPDPGDRAPGSSTSGRGLWPLPSSWAKGTRPLWQGCAGSWRAYRWPYSWRRRGRGCSQWSRS